MGVVAEHGVDGFVYTRWVGAGSLRECGRDEDAGEDEQAAQLSSEFHFRLREELED